MKCSKNFRDARTRDQNASSTAIENIVEQKNANHAAPSD
jgi:hypothetical protein